LLTVAEANDKDLLNSYYSFIYSMSIGCLVDN